MNLHSRQELPIIQETIVTLDTNLACIEDLNTERELLQRLVNVLYYVLVLEA